MRVVRWVVLFASLTAIGCPCKSSEDVSRIQSAADAKNQAALDRALSRAHLVVVQWTMLPQDAQIELVSSMPNGSLANIAVGGVRSLALLHSPAMGANLEVWARGDDGRLHRIDIDRDVVETHDYAECGCGAMGGGAAPPPPPRWMIALKSPDELGAPITLRIPFIAIDARPTLHGARDCPPPP
jgi:hypothetical protein